MEANAHQAPELRPQEVPGLTTVRILPSPAEEAELAVIRALAKVMDDAVLLPGTNLKVGLDALLGLLPVVGDLGSAAIGGYILRAAARLGVPSIVIARMLLNLLIDAVIGFIPVAGDYLDILFKANMKNVALVEWAMEHRTTAARASWLKLIGTFAAFALIVGGGLAGTVFVVKWLWSVM